MKIICDTREQLPYSFDAYDCEVITGKLTTADYSLFGLEERIAIEIKHELSDFISCLTSGRDRFKRELQRMKAYEGRAVIIESTYAEIIGGQYRSRIKPNSILGSIASWSLKYQIPFMLLGTRQRAEQMTYFLLKNFYQNKIKEYKLLKATI